MLGSQAGKNKIPVEEVIPKEKGRDNPEVDTSKQEDTSQDEIEEKRAPQGTERERKEN